MTASVSLGYCIRHTGTEHYYHFLSHTFDRRVALSFSLLYSFTLPILPVCSSSSNLPNWIGVVSYLLVVAYHPTRTALVCTADDTINRSSKHLVCHLPRQDYWFQFWFTPMHSSLPLSLSIFFFAGPTFWHWVDFVVVVAAVCAVALLKHSLASETAGQVWQPLFCLSSQNREKDRHHLGLLFFAVCCSAVF